MIFGLSTPRLWRHHQVPIDQKVFDMRQNTDSFEEMDFMPSITDGERIRFDIRHVSGVRRLRFLGRVKRLVASPMAMTLIVWLVMAALLALEGWR